VKVIDSESKWPQSGEVWRVIEKPVDYRPEVPERTDRLERRSGWRPEFTAKRREGKGGFNNSQGYLSIE